CALPISPETGGAARRTASARGVAGHGHVFRDGAEWPGHRSARRRGARHARTDGVPGHADLGRAGRLRHVRPPAPYSLPPLARPCAGGALGGCCACLSSVPHWFSSSPALGATRASSPATGVSSTPSATAPAPRAASGSTCTPASGLPKVPRTYNGDLSENTRTPLLCGLMSRSSVSSLKLTLPSICTSAFSVSNKNSRGVITPRSICKSATPQLICTSSSPNSLLTT